MSNKITVAENLERLALQYQAVIDAAAMLKEIGKLEQVMAEAKKAAAAAGAELDGVKESLAKAKAEAKKVKEKEAEVIAAAEAKAAVMADEAVASAAATVANAESVAKSIIDKANAGAAAINEAANAEAKKLSDLIGEKNSLVAGLDADIAQKTAFAKDLEARIEKAQAQVAKLLG